MLGMTTLRRTAFRGTVLCAGVLVGVIGCSDDVGHEPSVPPSTVPTATLPPPGVPTFDGRRADEINTALDGATTASLASAVLLPNDVAIPEAVVAGLSATAPWKYDLSSVRYVGTDAASVLATTAQDPPQTWRVILVLDGTAWKIAATDQEQG
ncbi:hypothetical protein DFR75_10896 [Nocardia ignorata]|uniref:Uncharacterized protein n=2 Tax=Nocardia ignorata TaxID=145285 RepID=A0A4R6P1Y1_NOCIG|nr:hypothetical protein DFR75_10896 [Nocardia ignorata]